MLFGTDDTGRYVLCSGTLLAPNVFLTAAHCLDEGEPVEVSFDTDVSAPDLAVAYSGTAHLHLHYGVAGGGSDWSEIAVVVLGTDITDVTGIVPAELPPLGLLDEMKADHTLADAVFTAVGYGYARDDKTGGYRNFTFDGLRRHAFQTAQSLQATVLKLSMQPSTGDGGTCYGDSGGPHFQGGTVTGDAPCRATDHTYRLDTESALGFLAEYVG